MAAKPTWRSNLWLTWRILVVLIALGMFAQLKYGDFSSFWLFALFGLPTIILANDLSKSAKRKLLLAFTTSFIICGIYCLTPVAKRAHIQHDSEEAAQSTADLTTTILQQRKDVSAAIQQKRKDEIEAKQQAQKAAAQAKQNKLQNQKMFQDAGNKLIDFQANCMRESDPFIADAKGVVA